MKDETGSDFIDFDSTMSETFDQITADKPDNTDTGTPNTPAVAAPEKAAPAETAKADNENPDQGTKPDTDPAKEQPVEAPARWSAEDKAKFATLPREAQDILIKRESDVNQLLTQKTQEIAEQKKNFELLESVLAPRRQGLTTQYGSEAAAIHQLFSISDFADRDPAGFTLWFAQQRGIDLSNLKANAQPDQQKYIDPELAATKQTVAQLAQRIEHDDLQKLQSEIDGFSKEAGADGKPLYPHFETVRVKMGKMMEIGEAKTLKEAYEQAVYANPTTRQAILDEQRKAEEAKRHTEAKEAANNAKKAANVNLSNKGGGSGAQALGSMEDTMSEVYDRMQGAA